MTNVVINKIIDNNNYCYELLDTPNFVSSTLWNFASNRNNLCTCKIEVLLKIIIMWGSKARTQGKHNSTIHSLHWIEDSSVENDGSDCTAGGWLAFGGGNGALGVNWIGNGSTSDEKVGTTKDGSLYRSHFNLRGHTGGVGDLCS